LVDRVHREFFEKDIKKISGAYHEWRKKGGKYEDEKGFSKSATLTEVQKHGYVLAPGRYVGIKDAEDDGIPFEEKMKGLTATLKDQMAEEAKTNEEIKKQLKKVGFEI